MTQAVARMGALTGEAVRHLQALLRIDTTNPPGNELAAAEYLAGVLREAGYAPEVIESAPGRGNVVARLPGTGELPPLLLYGHVDVVTAEPDHWTHPPFSGVSHQGYIWGRGALDMKGLVVQELMVMLLLQRGGERLRRDVIFAATADEEAGGRAGMGYLVEHHPDLIRAEYALSEGGGTTTYLGGRPVYDVRTAEKGTCRFRLIAHGNPGHGSVPRGETAVGKIAEAVTRLADTPLPFRATATVEAFFTRMGDVLGLPEEQRQLTPENLRHISRLLPPALSHYLHAITHDTAVPTQLHAGSKINVIPSWATAGVDGRYLPGETPEDFLHEIRQIIGPEYDIEPLDVSQPLETPPNGPLYETIVAVMARRAPDAPVVPMMLSGATDAKHVTQLGTACLGFGPLQVPEDFPAEQLVHGHNERVPIDGYVWGIEVLRDIVTEFCR